MSTRESMKENTLLKCTTVTHHTHLQGPKGEESNLMPIKGVPLGAGPG